MAEESGTGYLVGIVTGALLGAAAALLLAPKPGGELRQDLATAATRLKDKANDLGGTLGETVADRAREVKERGGDLVAGARAQGKDALHEGALYAQDVSETMQAKTVDFAASANGTAHHITAKAHDVVESV